MKSYSILKKVGIISCALILTVAIAGGVMALVKPLPDSGASNQDSAANLATQANANYIGEEKAKAIALSHAGLNEADVSHLLCKFEYDDGVEEYDVEFWDGTTEYDYEINALSGEITSFDYDMESYDTQATTTQNTPNNTGDSSANGTVSNTTKQTTTAAATTTEYIGEAKAKSIALSHAGVSESEAGFIKCEFDFDDGRAEYEVEWEIGKMEYEYTISASDGTIWEHDVEKDD